MQSWGFASRFTRRTTAGHPTKSAIVGMLAAALGIDKHGQDEAERIAPLANLSCVTIALPKPGVDGELPVLRLLDYHTIGGGYPAADWMKKPRAASGAKLDTVLSERHYLLDARFGVLLEGDAVLVDRIAAGLRNPVWGLWLGRKCCIPASPILVGVAEDTEAGWKMLATAAGYAERPLETFNRVVEGPGADGLDAEWLDDLPVAFGAAIGERHAPRRIKHINRSSDGLV